MAILTLIAAISADGFISNGRGVPWVLPRDKEHFRNYARGKWLLLGRQTYEEMLGWFADHYPLVLSRNENFVPFVGEKVTDVKEALHRATAVSRPELLVCGGAGAYSAAMQMADRLVITHVDHHLGKGVPFPAFSTDDWAPVTRTAFERDDSHAYAFAIVTYQRIRHYQHAA